MEYDNICRINLTLLAYMPLAVRFGTDSVCHLRILELLECLIRSQSFRTLIVNGEKPIRPPSLTDILLTHSNNILGERNEFDRQKSKIDRYERSHPGAGSRRWRATTGSPGARKSRGEAGRLDAANGRARRSTRNRSHAHSYFSPAPRRRSPRVHPRVHQRASSPGGCRPHRSGQPHARLDSLRQSA